MLCVDNFFTGAKRNIAHLLGNPRFEFMRHDVTFPLYVEVDEIYNLACPASPIHYQHDPVQTTKTSVHGAINMLGLAKRLRRKILQASTSEVYGDPAVHPQTEDYWGNVNPIGPRSCYDEGKRCAETLFFDYHRQHELRDQGRADLQHLRPAHAPERRPRGVNFIVQALRGEPITIYGDGSQTRSFCYVDDLVDGLIRLMDTGPEVTGPVNLGNPREFTILRAGRDGDRPDGEPLPPGAAAAPAGRSAPAAPRHRAGRAPPGLDAANRPRRGPGPDHRLLPRPARRGRARGGPPGLRAPPGPRGP